MLTRVDVRSNQGALLTLPLNDTTSGLVVQNIDGLDPVKATIVHNSFAQLDGTQYQSSRREARNLKLTLGLAPDYITDTVGDLRSRLYNFFMPKSAISLSFYMDDDSVFDISGRVESFETALFSQEPEVDISLICFDPDFKDPTGEILHGNTVSTTTRTLVTYQGTVETGVVFDLHVNRSLTAFTIYHNPPDGTMRQMDFAGSLVAGDLLTISSVVGSKGAILTRSGVQSSLLYSISPQSAWIELMPGDNYIRFYAPGAAVPYDLSYTNRYGGL